MTRVQYEWTANDNKTKVVVNTLDEVKAIVEKFEGTYKVKYTEGFNPKHLWEEE